MKRGRPMTRKFLYSIMILICAALLSGCHFEITNPDSGSWSDSVPPAVSDELDVSVITQGGGRLAYRGEELLITISPEKITDKLTIQLVDDLNTATTLAEDFQGPFPFSWIIPDDFPAGESYRVIVSGSYYKNEAGIYGRSDEFAILAKIVSGLTDISVSSRSIDITLTDSGSVIDGDTVSISLNGSVLDANHILAGAPGTTMSLELLQGINTLSITAVNEGSVSPNTAEITFSGVTAGEAVQEWRLSEGETGTLSISAP